MNRVRLSPIFGLQTLRSVGVTVAAMDLSRPFQRPKYRFHHSTAPSFTFYNSRQPAFPSTRPHQTRRTPPTPILQAILTGPGVGRCRKFGPRAARRAECVCVLFDHLLSLVHDPSAQGSWPRTTNPMARHAPHTTCTWPCAAAAAWLASNIVVAAHDHFCGYAWISSRCTPVSGHCDRILPCLRTNCTIK